MPRASVSSSITHRVLSLYLHSVSSSITHRVLFLYLHLSSLNLYHLISAVNVISFGLDCLLILC